MSASSEPLNACFDICIRFEYEIHLDELYNSEVCVMGPTHLIKPGLMFYLLIYIALSSSGDAILIISHLNLG